MDPIMNYQALAAASSAMAADSLELSLSRTLELSFRSTIDIDIKRTIIRLFFVSYLIRDSLIESSFLDRLFYRE
jgi:hypothetical protein